MSDRLALRSLFAVLGVLAVTLLLLGALLAAGIRTVIVPQPDKTAEEFVRALKAHRYSGALSQLSQSQRQQISEADLQALVQAIEQTQQGIADASGVRSQEQGSRAQGIISVELGNRRQRGLEFPLTQEYGLWKIDSIEPIKQLAGP